MVVLIGIGLVIVFAFLYVTSLYNRLVSLRNQFKNAFAQIDVQLKRRYDLIPNLVETVKGYMAHERQTLEAVIAARNSAEGFRQKVAADPSNSQNMQGLVQAESQMTGMLGRLLAVAEKYPELKANQNVMNLQEELTSTENKISFARQAFNDAVMTYNTACEVFPNLFIARMYGFLPAQLFEIQNQTEREAPKVKF